MAPGALTRGGPEHLSGRNAVLEALRGRRGVRRVLLAAGSHGAGLEALVAEAHRQQVPVATVERHSLDRLAGDRHHQGVLAEVAPFSFDRADDLLARAAQRGEPALLLALDRLQDPRNFGALLRTALAAGAHGVLVPEHRAVGVTPAVARASAGAVEHLAVAREPNLTRALERLKGRGVWAYGLAAEAGVPFWEVDLRAPCVVVVGSEGPGLGRLVRDACDGLVRIPMAPGSAQSLNAAVAGSIVLYEAVRQRRAPG